MQLQWLLVKNRQKHQRHCARSHRMLQWIRQVMQSTLLGQFQQQIRFPTSGNADRNQRFLFTLSVQCGSDPGRPRVETCDFQV